MPKSIFCDLLMKKGLKISRHLNNIKLIKYKMKILGNINNDIDIPTISSITIKEGSFLSSKYLRKK